MVSRRALSARLTGAARVTLISAPAGSGKTFLLRSWIGETGLASSAAWVPVPRQERDPQRFWISVADALRGTTAGSTLVRELTAAPGLDGWAIVERLLKDLAPLNDPIWLVIDDVHELGPDEALRQLELLVMRGPPALRLVLATRHDLRLGLHRLRLEGELAEIRADDLRFSLAEARELFAAAGVELSEPALAMLRERTEGWAAGLRLAALSLAGHDDPERFAAEFSGSERTVAEYLLAEVLERQSEEVRCLLLRTSVLERVNGELADLLTSGSGSERILQDLEQAGAFVVSLDGRRSWFRYHQMFADLLELELRRTAPEELTGLHAAAASWFADHGYPVEAIRHAQAARDWDLAARLLSDHWVSLELDGQAATAHALLAGFPASVVAGDAELTALRAFDELERGSLEEAERQHALAARMSESVPGDRRDHLRLTLTVLRLSLARRRGDLPAAVEEARLLLASMEAGGAVQDELRDDLSALAVISLGIAETWSVRYEEADRHFEQGVTLARRVGRPYLEILGLAHWAVVAYMLPSPAAVDSGTKAVELARRHGWTDEPVIAAACVAFGSQMLWQGRLDEAALWLEQGERAIREEADPVTALGLSYDRGVLELARGRDQDALAALRHAERLARRVAAHHPLAIKTGAFLLHARVRLGQTQRVEQVLNEMDSPEREAGEIHLALAALRLAQESPRAATAALMPVLDGSAPVREPRGWVVQAFLLEGIARDALGDVPAVGSAVERALDLAELDGAMLPFLLHPASDLLNRHARHGTAHTALISRILDLLAGEQPRSASADPARLHTPLSDSESRVLRYLPTNLRAPEIAGELNLSVNTVRTHMRHVYEKLGAHSRTEAVERARALGLVAPSSSGRLGEA
jgi:LuxR family transcriptional regulator, maltose regulon positive regulatory protein